MTAAVTTPTEGKAGSTQGRVVRIVGEMEEDAMGIVNLLEDARRAPRPAPPVAEPTR